MAIVWDVITVRFIPLTPPLPCHFTIPLNHKPLRIPSSAGLVFDLKKRVKPFSAKGKQGPAAWTNNKQENVDQIQANNVIKRNGVRINTGRNSKILFPKQGLLKKMKTLPTLN